MFGAATAVSAALRGSSSFSCVCGSFPFPGVGLVWSQVCSHFHSMTVSCPSGLCFSVSLPLVTSQARLESDVLKPQPGVTAGFCRMFQALGGQDRYPAVPYDLLL